MKAELTIEPAYTLTLTRKDAEDLVFIADNYGYIKSKFGEVNVDQQPLWLLAVIGNELKKLGVRS